MSGARDGRTDAGSAELLRRAGEAERAGNASAAIDLLREARRRSPRDGGIAHRLGIVMLRTGERVEAITVLRSAIGLLPRDPGVAHDLGMALFADGRFAESAKTFERSSSLDPARAVHLVRLAAARERLHDIPGAGDALRRAIALEPGNPEALVLEAELMLREGRHRDGADRVGSMDLSRFPAHLAARAWNVVGRALEKAGDADGAFAAHMRSNDTMRGTPEARAALAVPVEQLMRETLTGASPEMFARWRDEAPEGEPAMVWLVGMPRSGTTVMEQVLAMLPGVATNDERARATVVYESVHRMTGSGPRTVIERLDGLTPAQVRELRALFYAEVARSIGDVKGARVLIDKQPMRVMDAALVQRLFPGSKMIMMVRDPRDVCLSALFQTFNPRPVMSRFMAPDTAGRLCAEVMTFWPTVRPWVTFGTLEVRYEELVRDFEAQTRRIAEFAGLEWTDAVYRFDDAARSRTVRSASYTAVTQGINDRSIGRWRAYRAHLGQVLDAVRPVVEAYGYDPE